VRFPCLIGLSAALSLAPFPARAKPPDAASAFVAGASVFLVGFAAGGVLIGTADSSAVQQNAGWLTIAAGFALAPATGHALAGEWTRGLLFAAPPTAAWVGTLAAFESNPGTIDHGSIEEQRVIWSLFGIGLLSTVAGLIDTALAGERRETVAVGPMFGSGQLGLRLGATL
jgi:hypothetical protein